jgi:hypothetical protein
MSAVNEANRLTSAVEQGDPQAAERLLPLVYAELRTLASRRLEREAPGQTLQATALVHEAYLRLVGSVDEMTSPVTLRPDWSAGVRASIRLSLAAANRVRRSRAS